LLRDFPPGCTLATLIDHVRGEHLPDRLVVSVAVNGQHFGDPELQAGLSCPLNAGDQVDLESGDRRSVACEALRGVAAELEELGELQPTVAEQLNAGQTVQAIEQISDFVHAWQACRTAVVQCSGILGRDLTQEQSEGRSIRDHIAELAEKLRGLRAALQAHDLVLLADLIHYEMPDLCARWHDLLISLADTVEQGAVAVAAPNVAAGLPTGR
jgi:hypothetical protein